MKTNHYLLIDQYGNKSFSSGSSPRQALLSHIGKGRKLFKIFIDGKDGKTYHVGYGSGQEWYNIALLDFMRLPV